MIFVPLIFSTYSLTVWTDSFGIMGKVEANIMVLGVGRFLRKGSVFEVIW